MGLFDDRMRGTFDVTVDHKRTPQQEADLAVIEEIQKKGGEKQLNAPAEPAGSCDS